MFHFTEYGNTETWSFITSTQGHVWHKICVRDIGNAAYLSPVLDIRQRWSDHAGQYGLESGFKTPERGPVVFVDDINIRSS